MKILLGTAIVLFWAAATGALVRREVSEGLSAAASVGYRATLSRMRFPREERWSIRLLGAQAGTLETGYERMEEGGGYRIRNELRLRLSGGGAPLVGKMLPALGEVRADWQMELDPKARPSRILLSVDAASAGFYCEVEGWFRKDLFITYTLNREASRMLRLEVPPNALFGLGPAGIGAFPALAVGKEWTVSSVDPLTSFLTRSIQVHPLRLRVESRQKRLLDGIPTDVFVVSARAAKTPSATEIWVSPDGEPLRILQPGIELVRMPAREDGR